MHQSERFFSRCAIALALAGACIVAPAQEYPAKPLTFVAPFIELE